MKKGLRAFSLVVTLSLTLTAMLPGCTQTDKDATNSDATNSTAVASTSSSDDASIMSPFAPYPETVTLTVARVMNKGQQFAAGESSEDNGILRVIKKKLNVEFKIAWETTSAQYMQKLALSIAGGDLPDVFQVLDQNAGLTFKALAGNNALADLTGAYDKTLGGLAADALKQVDKNSFLSGCYYDGKLYGISAPADVDFFNLLWVRNDWLKKLNLEVPKTVEDIEKVAKQFIANDMSGKGKTIGLAMNPLTPLDKSNSYYALSSIANSVGAFPKTWVKDAKGQISYGSIAPETKTALGILADWYQKGILDKSFITYKSVDDVTPMINDSQIGMLFAGWWESWIFADMVKNTPGAEWIPVLAPLNSEGKFAHSNSLNPGMRNAVLVSSECKYPEAVIKAMNVEFDAINGAYDNDPEIAALLKPSRDNGSIGRTTSPFGNGRIASNFERVKNFTESINNYIKTGKVEYNAFNAADKDYIEGANRYNQKKDSSDTNGVIGYYGHYLAGNLTQAAENVDIDEVIVDSTDSMGDLWPAMKSFEEQAFVQIITGEKPLSYFDEFAAQWKSMGGDLITKEVQELYK